MSEQNKQTAAKYVAGIRDILKQRTLYGIKRLNQLISVKTTEIASELLVFNQEIATMNDGNLDVTEKDIARFRQDVAAVDSGDAIESLDKVLREVDQEIDEFCRDMNQMYTWYANYVDDIIDRKINNITDSIRMKLMAERRFFCCTELEHINFCYNISSQNGEITHQLESVMKVINIIDNTVDTVNSLSSLFTKNGEKYPPPMIVESKHILDKISGTTQSIYESLLKGEEYYLGSMVRKLSYQDLKHVKNFILRNYRTTIQDLRTYANKTTEEFKIVHDEHWARTREVLFPALKTIGDDIKEKAMLINDTAVRDEYLEKAEFKSLKIWMHDQFVNATTVVNALVNRQKEYRTDAIELETTMIVNQKLPFISSFSVENYLPSDVCPLSVDFQQYISALLEQYPHSPESHLIGQLFNSNEKLENSNATTALTPLDNLEMEVVLTSNDDDMNSDDDSPNSLMKMIQSIIKTIMDAGYSIDVYIDTDDTEDKKEK